MIQASSRFTQSQKMIEAQEQSQRKLKTLFYVKSKHTRKNFKNHPYFRIATEASPNQEAPVQSSMIPSKIPRRSLINQKRLKTQSHCDFKNPICNQFVSYPTQFGLQNTYIYMRDKSFIAKFQSENSLKSAVHRRKSPSPDRKIQTEGNEQNQSQRNYMKATASYESKFYNTTKTQQNQKFRSLSGYDQKFPNPLQSKFQRKPLPIFKLMEKRNSVSINNQPQLLDSRIAQSVSSVNRNVIYNAPILKASSKKSSNHFSTSASHNIQFIYAKRLKSVVQIPYRTISFDLFPCIITTFLKCKIHYNLMTQHEYDFINEAMIKVLETKKKPQKYDIKDIINIGSIKQVMKFLEQFKGQEKDFEWVETIRHFFLMKDQKVLDYHMNKIKQQVAKLIAIKFDVEFGQKQLFVYDLEKKSQAISIYDLAKGSKFLISDDSKVLTDYLALQNQLFEKQTLQTKIKKWKGIVENSQPASENGDLVSSKVSRAQSKSVMNPLTPVLCPTKKLSEEKFKDIFEQFKIRQQKRMSKQYTSGQNSAGHSLQNSFIERSKLKREQDFFQ